MHKNALLVGWNSYPDMEAFEEVNKLLLSCKRLFGRQNRVQEAFDRRWFTHGMQDVETIVL